MPSDKIPQPSRHRASGQAVVRLNGRDIYLGVWRSAAAREEYDRVIRQWLASNRQLPSDPQTLTIVEMIASFRRFAATYYRRPDGSVTSEVLAFDAAIAPLLKLYGKTPAAMFDCIRLEAVRDEMIQRKWVRSTINNHITRIRRIFKWAASKKMISASIWHELMTVEGLREGRSGARESEGVESVAIEHVDAAIPHLSRQVAAMIRVQLHTGMRPGEVVLMRTGDIDRSGKPWVYRPQQHKNQHRGHDREIFIGPKAQEVIAPFLKLDPAAYLFDPRDAEAERRERMHAARKTPIGYGNRPGSNRKRKPERSAGERYDVASYRRAIQRACDIADAWQKGGRIAGNDERIVPRWHPHQLRHTAATEIRKSHGLEAAGVILGHKSLDVTEIYAEKNIALAKSIMSQVG